MSGAKTDETPALTARTELRFGVDRSPTRRPQGNSHDLGHRHVGTRGSRMGLSLVDKYPVRVDGRSSGRDGSGTLTGSPL